MPLSRSISILAFVLGCLASVGAAQVIRDQQGPGIIDRGIVISNSAFNRAEVKRIALEFLEQEAKGTGIARLLVAPNQKILNENYSHGTPHNTYQSTIDELERSGMPKGPTGRFIAVGGRGKISYLEEGKLTEEVLFGASDPTVFRDERYSYELLHFIFGQPGPASLPPHLYNMRMFFKASPAVSVSSCIRLFEMVRRQVGLDDLIIHIRSDPWFMEEQRYPAALVFTSPLNIPTLIHYTTSPSVTCGMIDGSVSCSGSNFVP